MGWFPTTLDSEAQSWRFDIVSLLAVIGGSSIEKHKQAITASPFAGFPRILPAPESLLDTDRPNRLPSVKEVTIIGVYSGTHFTELNFFANVIHKLEDLEEYEFQSYKIGYRKPKDAVESAAKADDVERGPKPNGVKQDEQSDNQNREVIVPLKPLCPLNLVTLISILMTIGLFIWAGMIHDGVALVGLAAMSLSTSAACLSAQWYPRLSTRTTKTQVIKGDIVMKTRNGAFIVVQCPEEITRELYGGAESCRYVFKTRGHQALLACSTVLLMAAIILFSNCGWTMQIAVGVAYIILNILYFALALLIEPGDTWDLSRYEIEQAKPKKTGNYTRALWEAIQKTGETGWVRNGGLAPSTHAWDEWLKEAKHKCDHPETEWDPETARDRLMSQTKSTAESATPMEGQQRAPPQMSASK
ncbi:hypothetical protein BDQ94DRAFT_145030 [Aspergillus welwitschiae]|uniref:Uncharacterized protein n=1 Tax=Aspergillus welwitschiae TaxID=1341132 RepID=A0A3F3Q120_9EURO|nr:hypothetical protein BDQ94DRAFT_145030 [Aspergillus welwitschiae]RDH32785.1 hypothetical protein BDQ94DRAFT_145030 [Aspergillus welwitschiae]GLA14064.1 hypothetical protein AnigIFM62618_011484 [Aspergillus niger]